MAGAAGATRRGVTMITRSVSILLIRRAAEQRPEYRHRPDPGHLRDILSVTSLQQTGMAKLWPSRNSTVVRALRRTEPGMIVPAMVTALVKSSSLTEARPGGLITPRDSTVGTKASSTPNFLNSIVTVGTHPRQVSRPPAQGIRHRPGTRGIA